MITMKRFILAFVVLMSVFAVGCKHDVPVEPDTPDTPDTPVNTWTYPIAKEDVIRMWARDTGKDVEFYVLKKGETGFLKTEDMIAGYDLLIMGNEFTVAPFYTSTENHVYYPIDVPYFSCADYQDFIDEVRNHPATVAGYNLRTDGLGYEEQIEQLWDLFGKLDGFYMEHSGNPAPPLMAK